MPAPFQLYKTTRDESFEAGKKIGLTWDWARNPYKPGGPWIADENPHYLRFPTQADRDEWNAYTRKTKENNLAWKEGWQIGFDLQLSRKLVDAANQSC
jgi:hypothetical protein